MPSSRKINGVALEDLPREELIREVNKVIESHEMLTTFMNSVDDGFAILDKDLRYISVNNVVLKRMNRKLEEIIGEYLGDLVPDTVVTGRIEKYRKLLNDGVPVRFERIKDKDVDRTLQAYAFKSGENLGLITRDISDIVSFEEKLLELQRHALLLRECDTLEQVYQVTISTMSSVLKHQSCDILMVKNNNLIQVASTNLPQDLKIPLNGKGLTVQAIKTMDTVLENDIYSNPNYITAHETPNGPQVDGFPHSKSELATPIIVDEEAIGVLNIESISLNAFSSNDKLLLEILALQVASTIKGIHDFHTQIELYKELYANKQKIQQAEEMNRLKTNFMSTATHEIRTPITSIKGYLEMIMTDYESMDPQIMHDYMEVIDRNVDRLEKLSDDLLENMRYEHKRIELDKTTVNICDIVNRTIQEIEPIIGSKNQRIIQGKRVDVHLECDEARITQVLTNLFTNASNYSALGYDIEVYCEETQDGAQVTVKDNGIGLDRKDMPKLFTPFPDIQNNKFRRGTGLGLSICKSIIELHGGEIWAESDGIDKGTSFMFTLPKNIE